MQGKATNAFRYRVFNANDTAVKVDVYFHYLLQEQRNKRMNFRGAESVA